MRHFAPRLAGWVTGVSSAYDYLCSSIEQFPDRRTLAVEFERAGFSCVTASGMTLGIVALHEAVK